MLEEAGIPLEVAEASSMAKGRGCNYCQKKGYRGRLGLFELMMVTAKIREMIFNGSPTQEMRLTAIDEGMTTMYLDGIDKTLRGVTTLEEVYRIAKRTEQDVLVFD
jgi:type IV pilus assembly protein PilB